MNKSSLIDIRQIQGGSDLIRKMKELSVLVNSIDYNEFRKKSEYLFECDFSPEVLAKFNRLESIDSLILQSLQVNATLQNYLKENVHSITLEEKNRIHDVNKDKKLAEGTAYEVSAIELKSHLLNHPIQFTTDERLILLNLIQQSLEGKSLSNNNLTIEEKTLLQNLNNIIDDIYNDLNDLGLLIHNKNKDMKLAEGTVDEVSANELRNHINNHPREITDEEKSQIILIKNKVDKISGKGLSSNDFTGYIKNLVFTLDSKAHNKNTDIKLAEGKVDEVSASEIRNHIDNHPISDSHLQNTDTKLAEGTANEVSASELRNLLNNGIPSNYDDTLIKSEINSLKNNKVDVQIGKGLSTNDFTDQYKTILDVNIPKLENDIKNISLTPVTPNTDTKLAEGTADEVSASEIRNHIDNNVPIQPIEITGTVFQTNEIDILSNDENIVIPLDNTSNISVIDIYEKSMDGCENLEGTILFTSSDFIGDIENFDFTSNKITLKNKIIETINTSLFGSGRLVELPKVDYSKYKSVEGTVIS